MHLTRRRLLAAAASGMGVAGGLAFFWRNRRTIPLVTAGDNSAPEMLRSEIGSLRADEKKVLWSLCQILGRSWEMTELQESDFVNLLDLKTEKAPSYLAEYRLAIRYFESNPTDKSVKRLLSGSPRGADDSEPHIRFYTIAEFLRLHLARGGFRRFGFANYAGFMGGPGGYRMSTFGVPK